MKWPMGAHGKNESESFSKQGKQEVFIVSWCVTFNIIFKTGFGQFGILLSDSGHVNLSSAYNGSIQRIFIRPEPNYRIFDDLVVVQVTTKVMSDHLLTRRHQFSTYLLGLAGPENGIGENTLLYNKGSKMLEIWGNMQIVQSLLRFKIGDQNGQWLITNNSCKKLINILLFTFPYFS